MVSPSSTTTKYALQPVLIEKHKKTMDGISATSLWKRELVFFQKLLQQYAFRFSSLEDKKALGYFQNLITYYEGEVVPALRKNLLAYERHLSKILQEEDELNTEYFNEHDKIMWDFESSASRISELKEELFKFIEKVM